MIVLNLTAELDESWSEDVGIVQLVIIKINNKEVTRFQPVWHIDPEDTDEYLALQAARWLQGKIK